MKIKILISGLIFLILITCKNIENPHSPVSVVDPSTLEFAGSFHQCRIEGLENSYTNMLEMKWSSYICNDSLFEGDVVQVDKFICNWNPDVSEYTLVWLNTSYFSPPLRLPAVFTMGVPTFTKWEERDILEHFGYLPNRAKIIVHVESMGQIYLLESDYEEIIWRYL